MLFNKNEDKANERIIYKTKSNMILGCKKAIFGLVLLIVVLSISPNVVKFVGKMQMYLISRIQLPLTRYTTIVFFAIILIIVTYIIWQIIGWYFLEYTLTDSKIIVKSGAISTKKNYMPYTTIQDVNTSQSIIARLFNIGTISVFNAYDNNQLELKNISNPSEVEDIIFSYMGNPRSFQHHHRPFSHRQMDSYLDEGDYLGRNEIYDEFEPITPITHERKRYQKRDQEYYLEDMRYNQPRQKYDYELYDDRFRNDVGRAIEEFEPQNDYSNENYHDDVQEDYSHSDEDLQSYHDKKRSEDSNTMDDSSEKIIRRHFDKFKK